MSNRILCPEGLSWQWQEAIAKMNDYIEELRIQYKFPKDSSWDSVLMRKGNKGYVHLEDIALKIFLKRGLLMSSSEREEYEDRVLEELDKLMWSGDLGQKNLNAFQFWIYDSNKSRLELAEEKVKANDLRNELLESKKENLESKNEKFVLEKEVVFHKFYAKLSGFTKLQKQIFCLEIILGEKGYDYSSLSSFDIEKAPFTVEDLFNWCRDKRRGSQFVKIKDKESFRKNVYNKFKAKHGLINKNITN